jgi:hypothetical protein
MRFSAKVSGTVIWVPMNSIQWQRVLFATVALLTKHQSLLSPAEGRGFGFRGSDGRRKKRGGRGCWVGPERGNQLIGGPSREKQTYKIQNQN